MIRRKSCDSRTRRPTSPLRPRLGVEPLEDRQLLSAVTWTIDQSQSSLSLAVPDQDVTFGTTTANVKIRNQIGGNSGPWNVGNTAPISGSISTNYVDDASIEFLANQANILGVNSGSYQPDPALYTGGVVNPDGTASGGSFSGTGTAPAVFGARVRATVVFTLDAAFASFYNVSYDTLSGVLPIASGNFAANSMDVGIKHALIAADGISIPLIGQPIADAISSIDAVMSPNGAAGGTITHTGALARRLTLPISLNLSVPIDEDPTHNLIATATGTIVADATLEPPPSVSVVGTNLFYKGSTRFNVTNNNLPGFSDDNAIAPDKTAYLPGIGVATYSTVSNYSRGINGVMVDLTSGHGAITADDFTFKVGNNNSPSLWGAATAPTAVTTRVGAGTGGSDRVELLWANNAIQKQWLEVIVEGNDALGGFNTNTGLASSYVFLFGHALGDTGTGNTATAFVVNSTDEQSARNNPKSVLGTPALITDVNDFNRDGNVNATDQQIPRNNSTSALTTALKVLNVGGGGPFAPSVDVPSSNPAGGLLPSSAGAIDDGLATALTFRAQTGQSPPAAAATIVISAASSLALPRVESSPSDAAFEGNSDAAAPLWTDDVFDDELFEVLAQGTEFL